MKNETQNKELNETVEAFDAATEYRFDGVADYGRLAHICRLHNWHDWAAVFDAFAPETK